jgi:hypothetical protein
MERINMSKTLRLVVSLALIPTGGILVLLSSPDTAAGTFIISLGSALIITGAVNAFREVAILRSEAEDAGEIIAKKVHGQLLEDPPGARGLHLVTPVRRGYGGYYRWITETGQQDLFFAGRSVLHRIDRYLQDSGLGTLEEALARKLKEGSHIRILFLDPRSDLIQRLAEGEGQSSDSMLSHIATSIGICRRLYDILQKTEFHAPPKLYIRLFDEVPYFAYHKDGDDVIVGFYFREQLGLDSGAYRIMDEETKKDFSRHFASIFDRASSLLQLSAGEVAATFNESLYDELCKKFIDAWGENRTRQLLAG